jgi:hypothetical protein
MKKNKVHLRNAVYISCPSQLVSVLRMLVKPKGASIQDRFILLRAPWITDKMQAKDIETLKKNDNRVVRIKTCDGEVMMAKVRFVSDSKRDVIYDLVSTTEESQFEKQGDQAAHRIGFEDIESVEAVDPS